MAKVSAKYRMPVLATEHVTVLPEDLPLYKKGVRTVTVVPLNIRQLYKCRKLSTITAEHRSCRKGVMSAFAAAEKCPDCDSQIVLGSDGDPRCANCKLILYPPPSLFLSTLADSYMEIYEKFTPSAVWSSPLTTVFQVHHAAEMYLKALGACSTFADDKLNREQFLYGDAFTYNGHDLEPLLGLAHPTLRPRLDKARDSSGDSVEDLVKAMPSKASELFRYGLLLKDPTGRTAKQTVDGDIELQGTNVSLALQKLCRTLSVFVHTEQAVLTCS